MRIAKRLLIVWCVWAFTLSVYAQSLKITRTFEAIPNSSVSALYKNEFGKWEKPLLDDTFPYALIRIGLEGNGHEVTAAKQKLGLYLGRLHMPLEKLTDKPNELLFLIPAGAGHVEIQCGDGCTNQTIIDLPRLRSNTVYYGKVHYVPVESTEVVEVVDKEQLLQELRAELASMMLEQQANQNVRIMLEEQSKDATKAEQSAPIEVEDTLSKYQNYAQNAKMKTLVMGLIGYSATPQLSYGAMIGQMYKGYGWYVNVRSNFQFSHSAIGSCEADGLVDGVKPFYSGKTSSSHFAVHGGFMMNVLENVTKNKFHTLGFYLGGGYGKRDLLAETTDGEWIKYAPTSHSGFAGNVGLFGSIAGVTLNVGVSTINFKYVDLEVGIGFMF